MEGAPAPLIPALTFTPRESLVDHPRLAAELEALHPHCFGWAMACSDRRREDAEDLLHDVYVKVLSGQAVYSGRSTFRTWVFGIIRLTASEHRRRRRLHAVLGMRTELRIDRPVPAPAPDARAIENDRAARTHRALGRLSGRQREVLQLVFYHDLTIEEAATIMDVSLGSARTHYARGKARLATLLSGERD